MLVNSIPPSYLGGSFYSNLFICCTMKARCQYCTETINMNSVFRRDQLISSRFLKFMRVIWLKIIDDSDFITKPIGNTVHKRSQLVLLGKNTNIY